MVNRTNIFKIMVAYRELEKTIVGRENPIIWTNSKELKELMAKNHPDVIIKELPKLGE